MNTANLKVGMTIKNYKVLCGMLGEKTKTGKSKQLQLEDFKRYFEYDNSNGNTFIITGINKVVKNKKQGGNKVYQEDFRKLMLHMLYKDKSENMLISKGSLYEAMNLVNENYKLGKQDIEKLSKAIEVPKEYISDFYGENNKKIRENTERNLKILRCESLIIYDIVTAVAIEKINIAYNELGTPILTEHGQVLCNRKTEYRKATKEEKQIILRCEAKAKAELGFKTDKDVLTNGAWKAYSKLVNEKLKESNTNINFYYNAYEITWNNEKIEEEYTKLGKSDNRVMIGNSINGNITKSINKSCKRRHTKAKNTDTTGMKEHKVRKIKLHSDKDYIRYHDKLTNTLIEKNAISLKNKIRNLDRQQIEFDI